MATFATLTGSKELDATLKRLSEKAADRIARGVVGAGLTVVARAIRKAAPVGPTGNAKKAIGKRLVKAKSGGAITGKAGINVGKGIVRKGKFAPHAHLIALGTKPRTRKRIGGKFAMSNPTKEQLSTGVMPANPFVRTAAASSSSAAMARMKKEAEKRLAAEAEKARKR